MLNLSIQTLEVNRAGRDFQTFTRGNRPRKSLLDYSESDMAPVKFLYTIVKTINITLPSERC